MISNRTRHAICNINYHFVWYLKCRRTVSGKDVARRLDKLIFDKMAELKGEVIDLTVQPDRVDIFFRFPPTIALYKIMVRLKGYTTRVLRKVFPWLKNRLPSLWTCSYSVGTAGHVSTETMRKYIEEQLGC